MTTQQLTETPTMPEHFDDAPAQSPLPPLVDPIIHQWCSYQGPHLTDKERRLLELLGAFVLDRAEGKARVTQEILARHLGVEARTIRNLIPKLRDFGFIEIEPVPAANGYEQYIYTLTGVYSDWHITRSSDKVSRQDVYQLQQDKAHAESLLAEVLASLAIHDPQAAENFSANGNSNETEMSLTTNNSYRKNYFSGIPQEPEREKPAPPVDEDAAAIEAALQDRWHIIGPSWTGKYTAALNWYTQKGPCRRRHCNFCREKRPDAEHPHREEFWHQWRAAEFEAGKPPDEENTVLCSRCNNAASSDNEEGMCDGCIGMEKQIEESMNG